MAEIVSQFNSGTITREQYWIAMKDFHSVLQQYQAHLVGSELSSIEILAEELNVVTKNGLKFVWRPDDLRSAPNILVAYGELDPAESKFLLAAANGCRVIFDVGANVGYYAAQFSKRMAEDGIVYAFEPVPETYQTLIKNVELNCLKQKIKTFQLGLGQAPDQAKIFLPGFSGSAAASLMNLHPEEDSREVTVKIETLDNLFSQSGLDRLDLIKMDIEGAELMALKGGLKTIEKHKPVLFIELLRKWSKPFGYHPNEVIALLSGLGYQCWTFDNDRMMPFQSMDENTAQTNFMFIQPQRHQAPNTLVK
ncbi:MAG: FkbM family methyltransferase [Betaproteobacteria bacterium]|nr:FkbM family methyltransferase [Betaproteobacteria bacterium]